MNETAYRRFAFALHGAPQVQDRGPRAHALTHVTPVAVLAEQVGAVGTAHHRPGKGLIADQALLLQPVPDQHFTQARKIWLGGTSTRGAAKG